MIFVSAFTCRRLSATTNNDLFLLHSLFWVIFICKVIITQYSQKSTPRRNKLRADVICFVNHKKHCDCFSFPQNAKAFRGPRRHKAYGRFALCFRLGGGIFIRHPLAENPIRLVFSTPRRNKLRADVICFANHKKHCDCFSFPQNAKAFRGARIRDKAYGIYLLNKNKSGAR